MTDRRKIKLVQELVGAIALTLLMQVMAIVGYTQYIWMCFLPLLMFFALGANFRAIPSMIVSYAVGELWFLVNDLVAGAFTAAFGSGNPVMSNLVPTALVIFLILAVHENLLEGKPYSNIPCIFMGLATSFFVKFLQQPINLLHLLSFWCYGIVLAVVLVVLGMAVCRAIFGRERAEAALMPKQPGEKQ